MKAIKRALVIGLGALFAALALSVVPQPFGAVLVGIWTAALSWWLDTHSEFNRKQNSGRAWWPALAPFVLVAVPMLRQPEPKPWSRFHAAVAAIPSELR